VPRGRPRKAPLKAPQKTPSLPTGCDAVHIKICEIIEEKPWLTDTEVGKEIGLGREAVGDRRRSVAFKALLLMRHPPPTERVRWQTEALPALRRRLKMLVASKNDRAVMSLGERLGELPPEKVEIVADNLQAGGNSALSEELCHAVAGLIRSGGSFRVRADLPRRRSSAA
jgi:hypothetical protein